MTEAVKVVQLSVDLDVSELLKQIKTTRERETSPASHGRVESVLM